MNTQYFQHVLDHITAHPDTWDQTVWHCGATHCFAGWAQILSRQPIDNQTARRDACLYLDLSISDAEYCFDPLRTLTELSAFLNDREGYNKDNTPRTEAQP